MAALLARTTTLDWRASGLFRTPENTAVSFRPAILIVGPIVGLYSVAALFSPINAVLYLVVGQASWHGIAQGILRPLVAWCLLSAVVRAIQAPRVAGRAV